MQNYSSHTVDNFHIFFFLVHGMKIMEMHLTYYHTTFIFEQEQNNINEKKVSLHTRDKVTSMKRINKFRNKRVHL